MWAGVLAIGAVLLVAAGCSKVTDPTSTREALASIGVPVPGAAIRAGAALEVLVGLAALVAGPPAAALVAGSYGAFAVVVWLARRAPDAADCGCFGRSGSPPSVRHLLLDIAFAVGAVLAAATGSASTWHLLINHPAYGVPFLFVIVTGAWIGYLVLDPPATSTPALEVDQADTIGVEPR